MSIFTYLMPSRFHPPEFSVDYFVRQQLTEQLSALPDTPMALIAASAGYGKTTTIIHALKENKQTFAWYDIHQQDNIPETFWSYIIVALQQVIPNWGDTLLKEIENDAIDFQDAEAWYQMFAAETASLSHPVTLVLDNYHHISHHEIHSAIQLLVTNPLPNLKIVLMARFLPLGMEQIAQQATLVIGEDDLRFTANDVAHYFRQHLKLDVSDEALNWIVPASGGRVISLHLIGHLIQRDISQVERIVATLPKMTSIFDYFAEWILNDLSPQMQRFLRYTGTLGTFSAPLSDHVLDVQNSASLIEQADQYDLFMIHVGNHEYQYHDLFAAFLANQLSESVRRQIHTSATQWYISQDELEKAADHALATQDFDLFVPIIRKATYDLLNRQHYAPILKWFRRIPDDMLVADELLLLRAWQTFLVGNLVETERYLQQIAPHPERDALKGLLSFISRDFQAAISFMQTALKDQQELALPARLAIALGLAESHIFIDNWQSAREVLTAFEDTVWQEGTGYIEVLHLRWLVMLYVQMGEIAEAQTIIEHFFAAAQHISFWSKVEGVIQIEQAQIWFYQNRIKEAIPILEDAIERLHQNEIYRETVFGQCLLAELMAYTGQVEQAKLYVDGLAPIAKIEAPTVYGMEIRDTKAIVNYHAGDTNEVEENLLQYYADGIPLYSRALLVYLRHKANTNPDAINLLTDYRDRLEQQGLVAKQIGVELLLAWVYHNKSEYDLSQHHILKAVGLAYQQGYLWYFVSAGSWIADYLHKMKHFAPHFINQVLDVIDKSTLAFTPREEDFFPLLVQGYTYQEMALTLDVSVATVKFYLKQIYRKLDVYNRTQAAQKLSDLNLV